MVSALAGERGTGLTYGSIFVSIPHDHVAGAIEKPSLWRLEFSPDPARHMTITRRSLDDRDGSSRNCASHSPGAGATPRLSSCMVIMWPLTTPPSATAQITYDLNFLGAPVFYSWPSQATLQGYPVDENNVQWSEANLKGFLLDHARNSGAKDIYLIAHSMGNRALTGAVKRSSPSTGTEGPLQGDHPDRTRHRRGHLQARHRPGPRCRLRQDHPLCLDGTRRCWPPRRCTATARRRLGGRHHGRARHRDGGRVGPRHEFPRAFLLCRDRLGADGHPQARPHQLRAAQRG